MSKFGMEEPNWSSGNLNIFANEGGWVGTLYTTGLYVVFVESGVY